MYDFNKLRPLLDKAEITIEEAAQIFKVSRVTLYAWCEGRGPNQALLLANAERLVGVIERAIEAKSLPLIDAEKPARMRLITEALRRHINGN